MYITLEIFSSSRYSLPKKLKQWSFKFLYQRSVRFLFLLQKQCVVTDKSLLFLSYFKLDQESKLILRKWNVVETSDAGQIIWKLYQIIIVFKPLYNFPCNILNITLICRVIYTLLLEVNHIRVELLDQQRQIYSIRTDQYIFCCTQ